MENSMCYAEFQVIDLVTDLFVASYVSANKQKKYKEPSCKK